MTDSILSNILKRNEYGTAMACSLINGLMLYCYARGSIMFICSLDAENAPTHYGMIACSTNLWIFCLCLTGYFSINYKIVIGPQ